METETIEISKPMMNSVRDLIKNTRLFKDETDFVEQAIIKQLSKMKDK